MLAFHHEITALWSLSFHPNVITLIAYDDATTSIVTPLYHVRFPRFFSVIPFSNSFPSLFFSGNQGDLDHFLHKDNSKLVLDDRMLIYLALSIAKGMQGIHDMGIIHRDLKTGNILIKFHDDSLPEVVICGMIFVCLFVFFPFFFYFV
jgi:serine/threonine protein kinase